MGTTTTTQAATATMRAVVVVVVVLVVAVAAKEQAVRHKDSTAHRSRYPPHLDCDIHLDTLLFPYKEPRVAVVALLESLMKAPLRSTIVPQSVASIAPRLPSIHSVVRHEGTTTTLPTTMLAMTMDQRVSSWSGSSRRCQSSTPRSSLVPKLRLAPRQNPAPPPA